MRIVRLLLSVPLTHGRKGGIEKERNVTYRTRLERPSERVGRDFEVDLVLVVRFEAEGGHVEDGSLGEKGRGMSILRREGGMERDERWRSGCKVKVRVSDCR